MRYGGPQHPLQAAAEKHQEAFGEEPTSALTIRRPIYPPCTLQNDFYFRVPLSGSLVLEGGKEGRKGKMEGGKK